MKKRAIYIPGYERWVTLGQYVKAVKQAKANPKAIFPHTFCDWCSGTGEQIVGEFFEGVQDRINQSIPYSQRGGLRR